MELNDEKTIKTLSFESTTNYIQQSILSLNWSTGSIYLLTFFSVVPMRGDSRQIFLDASHKRSYSLEFMFGYDSVLETSNQPWRQISVINSASCRSSPSHFSRALQLSATLREKTYFAVIVDFRSFKNYMGKFVSTVFIISLRFRLQKIWRHNNLLTRSISKRIQELSWQDRRARICQSVQATDTICIDSSRDPTRSASSTEPTDGSRESDVDDYSDSIQAL